jgi:hypothetical protein
MFGTIISNMFLDDALVAKTHPRFTQDTPKTRPRHSQDTPKTHPRHTQDTHKTHPRRSQDTAKTHPRHTQDTFELKKHHLPPCPQTHGRTSKRTGGWTSKRADDAPPSCKAPGGFLHPNAVLQCLRGFHVVPFAVKRYH